MAPVTLLDGGMGTELRARGVEVPSHVTSIWSARALLSAPEAVRRVHADYLAAGADVITVNNYALTPILLAREKMDDRLEELTIRATDLARRARDESGRPARIAGSVPPLGTSYRPDLVGSDASLLEGYRRILDVLASRVDLLLCETLASAREARAALTAARETELEVWLSWTLQGTRPDHLPSGETLREAYEAVAPIGADAYLVNCCGANFVTRAIPILRRLTDRPVGGYGNSADVVPRGGRAGPVDPSGRHKPLTPGEYLLAAERWIADGATVVGGCCSTRPAHIALLRRLIDQGGARA